MRSHFSYAFQKGYQQGYHAGYEDGIADAQDGFVERQIPLNLADQPIETMEISTRAYHCLRYCGCIKIRDVANLSAEKIATMRGLGSVSATEIANWLQLHEITHSAWAQYADVQNVFPLTSVPTPE